MTRIDYPAVGQGQDALAPEEFGYDAVGNLLGKRIVSAGANKATLYKYDALNRLTDVYYAANYTGSLSSPTYPQTAADTSYTYHGGSRLSHEMTDSTGTSEYEYDELDRLWMYKPSTPSGHDWIEYTYNNLNQKVAVLHDWEFLYYDYYANGWLKQVSYIGTIASYTYDQVGNRTRVDLGNTTHTTYGYSTTDPRYFVGAIGHYDSSNALLNGAAITYTSRDDSGNPTEIQDWDPARTYDYDNNNRLTSAGGDSFGYDWVGNRLNPPASPGAMVYDATDKLVTWPGQHQYTYYPTGSLYQQKNSGGTVQKTFAYTGAELLSSVTHAGVANPSLMEWDADSNRVSFTTSEDGTTTEFVYDTTAGIPAVLEEWDGEASVYYIREPGGELIARMAGANKQYYHFDELGSTRMLTNDSGTVTDTYAYDAWGKLTDHDRQTGSVDQPYLFVGQLGYYSHYQDENLFDDEYPTDPQFLQLGVRFYDALTGRFTQRDPIKFAEWSDYSYVQDNPLTYLDPSGQIIGRRPSIPLSAKISNVLNPRLFGWCWAAVCSTAVIHHIGIECGANPRDWTGPCVCQAMDNLETGLNALLDEKSLILKAGASIGKICAVPAKKAIDEFLNCDKQLR